MALAGQEIIDADGHIMECDDDVFPYLDAKYRNDTMRTFTFFPALDYWHRGAFQVRSGKEFPSWDAESWLTLMDKGGLDHSVIYPTQALGFGYIGDADWAAALARAYNDFVYDQYQRVNPRLKMMAVLPVQDANLAAAELRRAITELNLAGGMLASGGLPFSYGESFYDPLYEEADRLGCMLAIHGGSQNDLAPGFRRQLFQGFVLAHPFAQLSQFTSIIFNRIIDRYPNLRLAFLEAGCGWAPFITERLDRRTDGGASRQVRSGQIYFQAELDEKALPFAIDMIGEDQFIYASDFPHEHAAPPPLKPWEEVRETVGAFQSRTDLSDQAKRKILSDNPRRLYGFS
jgi:uncharacterized protein